MTLLVLDNGFDSCYSQNKDQRYSWAIPVAKSIICKAVLQAACMDIFQPMVNMQMAHSHSVTIPIYLAVGTKRARAVSS